jgi:hypothetical protein
MGRLAEMQRKLLEVSTEPITMPVLSKLMLFLYL